MSSPPPNRLPYYFKWMESTFSSRDKIDTLLAPERDAGNLSHRDYTIARNFLPYQHYLQYQVRLSPTTPHSSSQVFSHQVPSRMGRFLYRLYGQTPKVVFLQDCIIHRARWNYRI